MMTDESLRQEISVLAVATTEALAQGNKLSQR